MYSAKRTAVDAPQAGSPWTEVFFAFKTFVPFSLLLQVSSSYSTDKSGFMWWQELSHEMKRCSTRPKTRHMDAAATKKNKIGTTSGQLIYMRMCVANGGKREIILPTGGTRSTTCLKNCCLNPDHYNRYRTMPWDGSFLGMETHFKKHQSCCRYRTSQRSAVFRIVQRTGPPSQLSKWRIFKPSSDKKERAVLVNYSEGQAKKGLRVIYIYVSHEAKSIYSRLHLYHGGKPRQCAYFALRQWSPKCYRTLSELAYRQLWTRTMSN